MNRWTAVEIIRRLAFVYRLIVRIVRILKWM
ncbi:hypothetical protein P3T25_004770 [Paraburkholderia sp. GAS32]